MLYLGLGEAGGSDLVLCLEDQQLKVHACAVTVRQMLYVGLGQAGGSDLVLVIEDRPLKFKRAQ